MNYIDKDRAYVLNTYRRLPIDIDRVRGSYIYDSDGRRYLDFFAGIAVNSLGYDGDVIDAIVQKLGRYVHTSNYFVDEDRSELAQLLCQSSNLSKVFFTNSGAESSEAALKLVRKWGRQAGKSSILTARRSFHGRTTGALALTGQAKYKEGFEPLVPGVSHFTFNDVEELEALAGDDTAAVFVEPVQGEGGVVPMSDKFASALMELKKRWGFMLVVDEIQTGLMRCGTMFASQQLNIKPDVILLAKSLGGGLPLGAMIVAEPFAEVMGQGDHGSTFGGNPVACAGGLSVLRHILRPDFQHELDLKSKHLMVKMLALKAAYPKIVREVRGMGMMIGVDTYGQSEAIREKAFSRGLLLNVTGGTVIRLLPPLNIEFDEIDGCWEIMGQIMGEM